MPIFYNDLAILGRIRAKTQQKIKYLKTRWVLPLKVPGKLLL
jgi:hypothetical protein